MPLFFYFDLRSTLEFLMLCASILLLRTSKRLIYLGILGVGVRSDLFALAEVEVCCVDTTFVGIVLSSCLLMEL